MGPTLYLYSSFTLPDYFTQVEAVSTYHPSEDNSAYINGTIVSTHGTTLTTACTIDPEDKMIHFIGTAQRNSKSFNSLSEKRLYYYDYTSNKFKFSRQKLDSFIDRPSCILAHQGMITVATRDIPGKVIQYELGENNELKHIRTIVTLSEDIIHCLHDEASDIGYFIAAKASAVSKIALSNGTILSELVTGAFFSSFSTYTTDSPFVAQLANEYIYMFGIRNNYSVMLKMNKNSFERTAVALNLERHAPAPIFFGYGSYIDTSPSPSSSTSDPIVYVTILYRSLDHVWKRALVSIPVDHVKEVTIGTISETVDDNVHPQVPCMFKRGKYMYAALNLPNKPNCTVMAIDLNSDLKNGYYAKTSVHYQYTRNVNHPACTIYSCVLGKHGRHAYFTTRHSKMVLKSTFLEKNDELVMTTHYELDKELGFAVLESDKQTLVAASFWDSLLPELFLFDVTETPLIPNKAGLYTKIVLGVVAGLCLCVILLVPVCLIISFKAFAQHKKLKKQKEIEDELNRQLLCTLDMLDTSTDTSRSVYSLETGKSWIISMQDIEIQKRISEGAFSTVFRARWKKGGVDVAVKRMKRFGSEEDEETFLNEARTLLSIRHSMSQYHHLLFSVFMDTTPTWTNSLFLSFIVNILLFLGIGVEGDHRFIITEFMKNGSLDTLYSRPPVSNNPLKCRVSFAEKIRILCEVCQALLYLHTLDSPIIHRDLKPQNVLLDEHLHVKLCDFGLSKPITNSMTSGVGTFEYCSPEVLMASNYTEMADIYSFAIIMYEFLFEIPPYHTIMTNQSGLNSMHQFQLGIEIVNNSRRPEVPYKGAELDSWSNANEIPMLILERYLEIMRKCWSKEPSDRYTTPELHKVLFDVKNDYENEMTAHV